jgi:hypothetical protein
LKAIRQNPSAYYVNVHTTEFPNGALRGQLARGSGQGQGQGNRTFQVSLKGKDEVPGPGDQDGSGSATIAVDRASNQVCFTIHVTGLVLPATGAHVHQGARGVAGPIVVALTPPDSTGSSSGCAVVTPDRVQPALERRRGRPLCILDIAVPRDVEPAVGSLENVFLYDLDDLRAVVTNNVDRRRAEMPTAERLIADEVERYWQWLAGLATVPVLTKFRGEMEQLRQRELAEALRRLEHLRPEDRAAVEQLSRALMNKFLHGPTVRLRAAASNGRGLGVVDAVRYLFGLNGDADGAAGHPDEHTPAEHDQGDLECRKYW